MSKILHVSTAPGFEPVNKSTLEVPNEEELKKDLDLIQIAKDLVKALQHPSLNVDTNIQPDGYFEIYAFDRFSLLKVAYLLREMNKQRMTEE